MSKFLLICGAAFGVIALGAWLAAGANRGWTKTSVPLKTTDPVTGIEAIAYQPQFVPGIDFLGAGLLLSGMFAGIGLLIGRKRAGSVHTRVIV